MYTNRAFLSLGFHTPDPTIIERFVILRGFDFIHASFITSTDRSTSINLGSVHDPLTRAPKVVSVGMYVCTHTYLRWLRN